MYKHKPCAANYMFKEYGKNTICQLLRETYHMTDDPKIKMNLRVGISMAKAMSNKLREYKPGWDKGFFDEHD